MNNWQGTLGELITAIFEECEIEFGDRRAAAAVAEQIVNSLIEDAEGEPSVALAA